MWNAAIWLIESILRATESRWQSRRSLASTVQVVSGETIHSRESQLFPQICGRQDPFADCYVDFPQARTVHTPMTLGDEQICSGDKARWWTLLNDSPVFQHNHVLHVANRRILVSNHDDRHVG